MRSSVPVVLLTMVLSCASHHPPISVAASAKVQTQPFGHVFVVVEENENYADVIGNTKDMPYLNAGYEIRSCNQLLRKHASLYQQLFLPYYRTKRDQTTVDRGPQ